MTRDKRILITDDDDAIRTLLFTVLRRRGYKVDTARNGSEALEHLGRCHYAVILLDLMMPVLNGYEVLDSLEAYSQLERPLVIVLTAGVQARHLNPAIVAATVNKPFDVELLIDTITACIAKSEGRSQHDGCPSAESDCSQPQDVPEDTN